MTINIPVNKENQISIYLKLWNGILGLTEKEIIITSKFIAKYLELSTKVSDSKMINELLFNTSNLKEIRESLKMKENLFNNYKASLKTKGVIKAIGETYIIDQRLIPVETVIFKFHKHEDTTTGSRGTKG